MMPIEDFCKKLPKIELHAHLNGSLSRTTLQQLGCLETSIEIYQKKKIRTLEECFPLFKVAQNLTNTPEAVYTATKHVIEEFHADNVIYLELRTTPRAEKTMTKLQYIQSVINAIKDTQKTLKDKIIVKLICSIDRRHDQKTSQDALEVIIEMKNQHPDVVKGVDLCGDPTVGQFDKNIFEHARDKGLRTTIHCGEVKNDKEVMEILEFGPDRLGHGTCLHPDYNGSQSNWELYLKQKIPIECCMTSNLICGTSKSYKEHHVRDWLRSNLPFCIGTDDKGVFSTSLTKEYVHLQKSLDLSTETLVEILKQTVGYTFASEAEKIIILGKISEWETECLK